MTQFNGVSDKHRDFTGFKYPINGVTDPERPNEVYCSIGTYAAYLSVTKGKVRLQLYYTDPSGNRRPVRPPEIIGDMFPEEKEQEAF